MDNDDFSSFRFILWADARLCAKIRFWNDGFLCGLDPRKRKLIAVEREPSNTNSMILLYLDLQKAIQEKRIAFDPPLEDKQFGEASVDLRLGFRLVRKA